MQLSNGFSLLRLIILALPLLLVGLSNSHASGAYVPASTPNSKSQYIVGKVVFQKIKNQPTFDQCLQCYLAQGSFASNCDALKQCVTDAADEIDDKQLGALEYFLTKRYRLQ